MTLPYCQLICLSLSVCLINYRVIPVTGHGGTHDCVMLRILHRLDNRLTDGGKVPNPTHRPRYTA
jgi:hypothetical protein